MKLVTKALEKSTPMIGATSHLSSTEIMVQFKLFNPCGVGHWYITEYDPETKEAFGFANLGDPRMAELGYIPLDELESIKLPFGMGIERDINFEPRKLSEVMEVVKGGGHV
jgi:hypothetical protein